MAEIILFHPALGLRRGVLMAANRLREAGHFVHTPDLFLGEAALDDEEKANARLHRIGISELFDRASAAVEHLPDDLVYAGFAFGAWPAARLAALRPGARAAILLSGAGLLTRLGIQHWPPSVAVQVHYTAHDPFRSQEAIDVLAAEVRKAGAQYDFFEYPGSGHHFADPDLPDQYDQDSAELMWTRVLSFLQ